MTIGGLSRSAVRRIAFAIVAAEVRRVRETSLPRAGSGDWSDEEPIGDEGLGLDSLERLGSLGALAEAFAVDADQLEERPPRVVGDWIDWIERGLAAGGAHLRVHTSGSTGIPRLCSHRVSDLLEEARVFAERFPDRRRIVALVPAHHLYGIVWTALLPQVLGVPVVVRSIEAPLHLAAGDLVVAVPEQWAAIERLTRELPRGVMGVSSAGSLDDAVAMALLAKGLERLVDVYGSSETSAIGMREPPAQGYELLPRWRLAAAGNGDCCLVDQDGAKADLPDHVERLAERSLRPTGRRDGAVQIGGCNVWPTQVASVLSKMEGVAQAAVRLHTNGRLKAFIVPQAGQDVDELSDRLTRTISAHLAEVERPKSVRFGVALPRNAMGKLEDWS